MSQAEEAAIEVNDVDSAAIEIERRMTEGEAAEVVDEVEEEDTESSDEVSEEDSSEDLVEEPETEEPEEDQVETFETLNDFADALEKPLDEFMAEIKTTVKVNGEVQEVTLTDLKNGYQMEQDYRQKTTAHAEKVRADNTELEQSHAQIQAKLQEVDIMSTNLETQLMNEFNSVNWNQLEIEDREEWLVQRQKFGEKQQQVSQIKAQAQADLKQYNTQNQQQQEEALHSHLNNERELLLTKIPEWSTPDVMEAEQKELTKFLTTYGFAESEINQIQDHRLMVLVRDAFKKQGLNEKVDLAKKKVKKLPKIVKSGTKPNKKSVAAKDRKTKLDRYKASNSNDDLAAALYDRM